ncbi:MAG: Gfo/Idh/MocA family oxidoreductase [Ruminococcaceae bacterium]|nr:Gfo/Idh/MocA family oxidoreductase [Oscillospiraceae bacterium]
MKRFGFAIWGCGAISKIHAEAICSIDGARLVGAYDINGDALKKFCVDFGIEAFRDIDTLLESADIDAVCICLPSGLHHEAALRCIESGKNVVIEKPIALTSEEADDITKKAEKKGVFVTVISQLRFSEAARRVKDIVDSGKLGTITLGNAHMKYWRSDEYYETSKWRGTWKMDGGGALMNQGIHGVDLLQYFMGKVVSVLAVAKTLVHKIETEDTLTAVLEYENGAVGTIQATTSVYPGYNRRIEICGSKGSVVLCEDRIEICDVEGEEKPKTEDRLYSTAGSPMNMDSNLHALQLKSFIEDVITKRTPLLDAREGKKSVDIICAIYKSAQTGKKIYL